jgi:hypothetical protein
MTALDRLIPAPDLIEIDRVTVAAAPADAWQAVRHLDLASSRLVRALFAVRTLPGRLHSQGARLHLRIDDLVSSPEHPGFQILIEDAPHEIAVGAIGKVWHLDIPFVHVGDAEAFAAFTDPDFVKVAWAIRVEPDESEGALVECELRVSSTDADALKKFRRYFRIIGPASRLIRRVLLAQLVHRERMPGAVSLH